MAVYQDNTKRLSRLESRTTAYRFDLETDPQWDRAAEPGIHAPRAMLADFGVDVEKLGAHAETFDWVFAAAVCRTFKILEECVIELIDAERAEMRATASLESLYVEEAKHVAMFARYEDIVLEREGRRASFDRWFGPMGKRMHERHFVRLRQIPDTKGRHYAFWINTLFFEEFTIYLDERLQEAEGVQPTWLQIQRLHRIEETQHVATDEGYLEALAFEESRAKEMSQMFLFKLLQELQDTVAVYPAVEAMRELAGVNVFATKGITKLPFVRHILTRPTFRRTRAFAPYLQQLARETA
jgi:hypothetical protein